MSAHLHLGLLGFALLKQARARVLRAGARTGVLRARARTRMLRARARAGVLRAGAVLFRPQKVVAIRVPDVHIRLEIVVDINLLTFVLSVHPHDALLILVLFKIRLDILAKLEDGTLLVYRQDLIFLFGVSYFDLHAAAAARAAAGTAGGRSAALPDLQKHEHLGTLSRRRAGRVLRLARLMGRARLVLALLGLPHGGLVFFSILVSPNGASIFAECTLGDIAHLLRELLAQFMFATAAAGVAAAAAAGVATTAAAAAAAAGVATAAAAVTLGMHLGGDDCGEAKQHEQSKSNLHFCASLL
jgi:hypothetical protein